MEAPKYRKLYTLCFVVEPTRILLAMKKRGFGMGKWNGYGGKVHEGETIEEAAKREIVEEGGIIAKKLNKLGVNSFEFRNKSEILEVHVFKIMGYEGDPVETEEMRPKWFDLDKIPFGQMWKDDKYWLPLFLQDKRFDGYYLFDETGDTVLRHEVKELE